MAELNVSGAFLITRGMTVGGDPSTWVAISANAADGTPIRFTNDPDELPVTMFITLNPTFGMMIPLTIVEVRVDFPFPGFCQVRVETGLSDLPPVDDIHPATLGIVVDTGTGRARRLRVPAVLPTRLNN
jgi:hypothetical protein